MAAKGTGSRNKQARAVVNNALRDGRLKRPVACQVCHKPAKLEAHHPDHRNVAKVKWVCKPCHGKIEHPSGKPWAKTKGR